MRKTLFFLAASAATLAYAQPQPNMDVCKLMSREEMRMCLVSKPGADARGAYCDQVSQAEIEKCLAEPPRDEAPASGGATYDPRNEPKPATSGSPPERAPRSPKADAPPAGTKE